MKKLFLAALAIMSINQIIAQDVKPVDSVYLVMYTTGASWDNTKSPYEQPYFKEHSANLGKWRKEGIISAGARFADKGIIFIKTQSLQAARELILADPAVIHKLFSADIQKLSVFYEGCIEKPKPK